MTLSMLTPRMVVPAGRGPVSDRILAVFAGAPANWDELALAVRYAVAGTEVSTDEDLQLALFLMYELHYRGLAGVADRWEWSPDLLAIRQVIEEQFEIELRDLARSVVIPAAADLPSTLFAMTAPTQGPSLSRFMAGKASREQFEEFLTHRSLYQLKEADPHTWAIPRLAGHPKAAMVEIQSDEYGGGRADRMHATLFGNTMRALGLDDRYGALLDRVPAVVLAVSNTMSLFGLHRRLLGAIVGHLAALEMTSSLPNRLYGNGLRRLGFGSDATLFFDEHVQADAVHEQIAGRDLAGELARQQPDLYEDIVFGAAACLAVEDRAGDHILKSWAGGRSSLRAG